MDVQNGLGDFLEPEKKKMCIGVRNALFFSQVCGLTHAPAHVDLMGEMLFHCYYHIFHRAFLFICIIFFVLFFFYQNLLYQKYTEYA